MTSFSNLSMEEPRLGRLNSTNNNSQSADNALPDPGLPTYDDAIEQAMLADPVPGPSDANMDDNMDGNGSHLRQFDNMSEVDSDGLIFVGPRPVQGAADTADTSGCHDTSDESVCERQ